MSMDSAPARAYTISEANLNSLCPKEFGVFKRLCDESPEGCIDGVAQQWSMDQIVWRESVGVKGGVTTTFEESPEKEKDLEAAWKALEEAFTKVTATPDDLSSGDSELTLELSYYDKEKGGAYDDIGESQALFIVWGCVQLTPAAIRIQDKIEEQSWTVFA